jgi:hypothetical protein
MGMISVKTGRRRCIVPYKPAKSMPKAFSRSKRGAGETSNDTPSDPQTEDSNRDLKFSNSKWDRPIDIEAVCSAEPQIAVEIRQYPFSARVFGVLKILTPRKVPQSLHTMDDQ